MTLARKTYVCSKCGRHLSRDYVESIEHGAVPGRIVITHTCECSSGERRANYQFDAELLRNLIPAIGSVPWTNPQPLKAVHDLDPLLLAFRIELNDVEGPADIEWPGS